ncbi:MAG: DUF1963 domain-containing protein [Holophagales bacterium]|nr:DUF1963 domain-containing protein [Holophagales bacterium]
MNRVELEKRIHARGHLFGHVEQVISWIRPTVFMTRHDCADESIPSATTKRGGLPDTVLDSAWPRTTEGRAMKFVMQIDCRKVPPELAWPESGLVQFFADDWYSDSEHLIRFYPESTRWIRGKAEPDIEVLPSSTLELSLSYMLPDSDFAIGRAFDRKSEYRYGGQLVEDLYEEQDFHSLDRIGGYPVYTQSNLMWSVLQDLAAENGLPLRNHASLMNNTKAESRAAILEMYDRVELLLQVDWGEGQLVFAAPRSPDREIRFEKARFYFDHS